VDLNNGWDYWSVMVEQVEELLTRYNIPQAETFKPTIHDAESSARAGISAGRYRQTGRVYYKELEVVTEITMGYSK